jgi:hypothetical protein
LYFIEKLQADLNSILAGESVRSTKGQPKTEPEYFFTIQAGAKKKSNEILQYIHKRLQAEGYINCTLPQFRQVFQTREPKPIVWLKEYIHLSYLIKHMGKKFLVTKLSPNNYEIAHGFFHDREIGVQFKIKNPNHDHDSKNIAKVKFFNEILRNSIDYYLMEQ